MKLYLISLAVGILAGLLYGVLNVRSPAPPVVALIGLLGMLIGEQMVPYGKQFVARFAAQDKIAEVYSASSADDDTLLEPKTTPQQRSDA